MTDDPRWEADRERSAFRSHPVRAWYCLYCRAELKDGKKCPLPACVDARRASRKRMGIPEGGFD